MFSGDYLLMGMERSFFTRKLENILRFQALPYRFEVKTMERQEHWQQRSGQHRMPVMETPEGWVMWDTTPIGQFLSERYSERTVIPESPILRASCLVLEDFIDEWLGRSAVHSRWVYPENAEYVGRLMAKNMLFGRLDGEDVVADDQARILQAANMVRDTFGLKACKALGVGEEHKAFARAEFDRWMVDLATHFDQHKFLLGDRPCMADFSLIGGLKAHFVVDPMPIDWLKEVAPSLFDYTERVWDFRWNDAGDWWPEASIRQGLPETLLPLFAHMTDSFATWSAANRLAVESNEKFFTTDVGAGPQSFLTLEYTERSRLNVVDELSKFEDGDREKVRNVLGPLGVFNIYQ